MRVVYGLHAASGRGVILGHGNFQLATERKRANILHEALSEGAGAYDGSTVEVLKSTAHDFGRRCRAAVDQHHQLQFLVECVLVRPVYFGILSVAPA